MMIDEFGKIIIHREVEGILRFSCCSDNSFLNL